MVVMRGHCWRRGGRIGKKGWRGPLRRVKSRRRRRVYGPLAGRGVVVVCCAFLGVLVPVQAGRWIARLEEASGDESEDEGGEEGACTGVPDDHGLCKKEESVCGRQTVHSALVGMHNSRQGCSRAAG